jgi:predicted MFS family arabinose efflux permease
MLGQGLHPLMAAIGTDVFHTDEKGIGYLISSIGISSVLAAVLVIWVGERVPRSSLVRAGYVVYVVALLLVAATEEFWVGIAGFALTGIAHVLVHVSSTISVQVSVDEQLRGRVTAIYLMGIIVGLVADATSMATVINGCALGLAGFGLFGQFFLRGFRDLDHG